MNKVTALLIVFLACPLIAGLYGILHDQFTYTLSPEYYTKFKFIMFNTDPGMSERMQVCVVGFLATWWTGIPIGIIISSIGLIHYDGRTMLKAGMQAIFVVMLVTMITGLIGLAYGKFSLAANTRDYFTGWFIPDDVSDLPGYISVGSMHNFSYLGGAIGLFAGAAWQVFKKKRIKKEQR
jgi:hypothetical protein